MYTSTQQQKPEAFEAASGVAIPAGKCPCSRPLEGVWTTLQNPQPFWDVPQGCPAQLGLGAGQTEIFNWGFGAKKGAFGVRFGCVQADAGTRIGQGDPGKMSARRKILSPFGNPLPPLHCGTGRDGPRRGAVPVPCLLYIVYVQTGAQPSHSKNVILREKTWDVTWHRLGEIPKCSGKPCVPPCWFHPCELVFRAEDFAMIIPILGS